MTTSSFWRPYSLRAAFVRRLIPHIDLTFPVCDGLTIEASLNKHTYICRASKRRAEVVTAQKVAALAGTNGMIYDLGANIGLYSLVFAANRQRRIYAFEPFSEPLGYLRRNIARNQLTNIEIHPMVLSDHAGTCRFTFDHVTWCTSHISADGEPGIEMACSDLDSYMKKMQLPVPDVIKIDVEGADLPILRGMEGLLKQRRTRIFLEGGLRDDAGQIAAISYLEGLDYHVQDLDLRQTLSSGTSEYAYVATPRPGNQPGITGQST